jgi:hypothetical protein
VGAAVHAQQGRDQGPQQPARHAGQHGQRQVDEDRRPELGADHGGGEHPDGVLALHPDVEQPGLERDRGGQSGQDERRGPAEDESQGVLVLHPVAPHGTGDVGEVLEAALHQQDDQRADHSREDQRDGRGEQAVAEVDKLLGPELTAGRPHRLGR